MFPTLTEQNSPLGINFVAKFRPALKIAKFAKFDILSHQNLLFFAPKSPILPNYFSNFAQIVNFVKMAKNRPKFAGDFWQNPVATLGPKIAQLAKNRHSWERWSICSICSLNSTFDHQLKNYKNFKAKKFTFTIVL